MTILIVNHPQRQCGVQQFGENIILAAIKYQKAHTWVYQECSSETELLASISRIKPQVIIYNFFVSVTPWITKAVVSRYPQIKHLGIVHELAQLPLEKQIFDAVIIPDPTFTAVDSTTFKTSRLVPDFLPSLPPQELTFGSFGFGLGYGKYVRLIEHIQSEFDNAIVRLNIPNADFADADGKWARSAERACRSVITKPGIVLHVSNQFLTRDNLLMWLSANSLNAFIYDLETPDTGIASTPDYALAVRRPLAVNTSHKMRHLKDAHPSICIEHSSLREILANGTAPLEPFYKWTEENLIHEYEEIVSAVYN